MKILLEEECWSAEVEFHESGTRNLVVTSLKQFDVQKDGGTSYTWVEDVVDMLKIIAKRRHCDYLVIKDFVVGVKENVLSAEKIEKLHLGLDLVDLGFETIENGNCILKIGE